MADYSGTPLPQKLGIGEGSRISFVGAPDGFVEDLRPLPADVTIRRSPRPPLDVVVLFVRRRAELERRFAALHKSLAPAGGLWVAYPKKAAGVSTDLSFSEVQDVGLRAGLVDNKSCAIDDVWTAVRFVIRRQDRAR